MIFDGLAPFRYLVNRMGGAHMTPLLLFRSPRLRLPQTAVLSEMLLCRQCVRLPFLLRMLR